MRLDVEALEKCPCSAACASQSRQSSLHGDETHAVATRPRWASEHGLHRGVVHCVGGWAAGLIDTCSNKDAG